jgi:beta-galactosidase
VYKGVFSLTEVGDTYLDVSEYGQGYIWINGYSLGRYWEMGPQKRLFCPGVWLNKY